jgi:hypothetical protein
MPIDGSTYLEIEWIEMLFNTSGPVTGAAGGSNKLKRNRNKVEDGLKLGSKDVSNMFGGVGSWKDMDLLHGDKDGAVNGLRQTNAELLKRDKGGIWGRKTAAGCQVICTIDEVNNTGFPEVLYNATSHKPKSDAGVVRVGELAIWGSLLFMGGFFAMT